MHRLSSRERRKKEQKNPPEAEPEFQIAPMIDILLVLLVFFMTISTTEVLQRTSNIILPVAKDGKQTKNPGQITVNVAWLSINNTGSIEMDGKKYNLPNEIISRIQAAIQANPLARVYIRADKEVRWEYMRKVLKAIGSAGATNVTFAVVNKDMSPHLSK